MLRLRQQHMSIPWYQFRRRWWPIRSAGRSSATSGCCHQWPKWNRRKPIDWSFSGYRVSIKMNGLELLIFTSEIAAGLKLLRRRAWTPTHKRRSRTVITDYLWRPACSSWLARWPTNMWWKRHVDWRTILGSQELYGPACSGKIKRPPSTYSIGWPGFIVAVEHQSPRWYPRQRPSPRSPPRHPPRFAFLTRPSPNAQVN